MILVQILPARTLLIRTSLYRKRLVAVILAAVVGLIGIWAAECPLGAQELTQTYTRKAADPGPRALGLVQLSSTGKARLVPIVIMIDGKYYDAGSYKASPVPMAIDFGVVYEAFRTGVSQGTLTITQPGQLNHNWIAEGSWLPAGAKAAPTTQKYSAPVIEEDNKDDRPVLHRRDGGTADKDEAKPKEEAKPAPASTPSSTPNPASSSSSPSTSVPASGAPSSSGSSTTTGSTSTAGTGGSAPPTSTSDSSSTQSKQATDNASKSAAPEASKSSAETSKAPADDEPISDPNRPRLRRGKPDPSLHHEPFVNFDGTESAPQSGASKSYPSKAGKDTASAVQTMPAISDAKGPDPRPYTYDLKPTEEAIYRNKMLELASKLVRVKAAESASSQPSSAQRRTPATAKTGAGVHPKASAGKPRVQFDDVNLRLFDLSSSNEPVLVLSAKTPVSPAEPSGSQVPQEITLIARTDLEGELHKLFFAQTDSRHLDVSPRMELIDAVDVDGDGRGELLFRRTSDAGSAYAIYRVTADGLWALFEGTP